MCNGLERTSLWQVAAGSWRMGNCCMDHKAGEENKERASIKDKSGCSGWISSLQFVKIQESLETDKLFEPSNYGRTARDQPPSMIPMICEPN